MNEFVVELNIKHAKEFSVLFVKQPPKSAGLRKHQPFVRRPLSDGKWAPACRIFPRNWFQELFMIHCTFLHFLFIVSCGKILNEWSYLEVLCFPSLEFETCWVVFWMCIWKLVGSVNNSNYAILQFLIARHECICQVMYVLYHYISSKIKRGICTTFWRLWPLV